MAKAVQGGVVVIDIRGVLARRKGAQTSYEQLLTDVNTACKTPGTKAIMLRIDSPGGAVDGLFDHCEYIKRAVKNAKIPLHAHIDGQGLSAAYALACTAQRITCSSTGTAGSVGVIAQHEPRECGIVSGAKKCGCPEDTQRLVDEVGRVFAAHVANGRGLEASVVTSWEAGYFVGRDAVAHGLVDAITDFATALARLRTGATSTLNGKARMAAHGPITPTLEARQYELTVGRKLPIVYPVHEIDRRMRNVRRVQSHAICGVTGELLQWYDETIVRAAKSTRVA